MAAIALALLLGACVPPQPPIERLGGADDLVQRVDVDPAERPLTHVDVELTRAASVLVLYVVPGRGAAVIYPSPDAPAALMAPGSHRILFTAPSATRALADAATLGSLGELLLVATERPLDGVAVRDRLARIAISRDSREAVSDAARAVGAASPHSAWMGFSTRTWLLPADARSRGLLRMPRAQRAIDRF